MDGLDLLKKQWNSQDSFPKVTEIEIYKMIHQKSSSIVKWIFIISILEIILWVGLSFLFSDENQEEIIKLYHLDVFTLVATVIHWLVVILFIYLFYKNYKGISNVSSVKTLMGSILKVRKIVQYYVWYNVLAMFIILVIIWSFMLRYDKNINVVLAKASDTGTEIGTWVGIGLSMLIIGGVMCGILWLFYKVIYGILLKRLYRNYKELKKIEV